MWFPEGLEDSPFTIKMALLSLEKLLRGVLVIVAPPTKWVWAPLRSIGVPLLGDSFCYLPFYLLSLCIGKSFCCKVLFVIFFKDLYDKFKGLNCEIWRSSSISPEVLVLSKYIAT